MTQEQRDKGLILLMGLVVSLFGRIHERPYEDTAWKREYLAAVADWERSIRLAEARGK